MLSDVELIVQSGVAKDVLHNIIQMYVRVHSFSFANDIIQKHKMKLKQLKSKALCKDISRASKESDQKGNLVQKFNHPVMLKIVFLTLQEQ